jgi:hypothetical protein
VYTTPRSGDPVGMIAMLALSHERPRWAVDLKGMFGLGFNSEVEVRSPFCRSARVSISVAPTRAHSSAWALPIRP